MQHIFLAHLSNMHEKIRVYLSLFALISHIFARKVQVIVSYLTDFVLDKLRVGRVLFFFIFFPLSKRY